MKKLEAVRTLSTEDREVISHNLDRLVDLQRFPFTALEIASGVDEQNVADVFVRINSEGVKLKQADFILTLLSVVWPEGRKQLEQFAHDSAKPETAARGPSPFNHLLRAAPDQLLRVGIAVGFHRARLKAVYQILRAKDLDGTDLAVEGREEQLDRLRDAQASVLDLKNWHPFLNVIAAAGYRSAEMISSDTALIYSYALFLIGKLRCRVPAHEQHRLIARWFVANTVTGRYSGSSETIAEEDLAVLKDIETAEGFVHVLERRLATILTNDFWQATLPLELETSSNRSPAALAYLAAQVRLNARVLFSDKRIHQLIDPSVHPTRNPIERHHLFPKKFLERTGVKERRLLNQAANFAVVEWPDNVSIGAKSPRDYVGEIKARFSSAAWDSMCREHALPPGWHDLDYAEFLRQRRALMAAKIRRGYASLGDGGLDEDEPKGSPNQLRVWTVIREVETQLRKLVQGKYEERWGSGAHSKMERILGAKAVQEVEERRAKRRQQFPYDEGSDDLLDFTYFGQLIQLMVGGDGWEMFRSAFRDKRELEDLARAITVVRNEAAHFRHVNDTELKRCEVAASDLRTRLQRIGVRPEPETAV
jgi:hypothetical protein